MERLPKDVLGLILEYCMIRVGSYSRLLRVCRKWNELLVLLEKKLWGPSLELCGIEFLWVGIANVASWVHQMDRSYAHLHPRAPVSPLLSRTPHTPTVFWRLVATEVLHDAVAFGRRGAFVRPGATPAAAPPWGAHSPYPTHECYPSMVATRKALCKRGAFQADALVATVLENDLMWFWVVSIAGGQIIGRPKRLSYTLYELGIEYPWVGPRLDRRVVRLCDDRFTSLDQRVDISSQFITVLLQGITQRNGVQWYSNNKNRRYMSPEERSRELSFAGIDDPNEVALTFSLATLDWPEGVYKIVATVMMPKRTLVVIIHRHC